MGHNPGGSVLAAIQPSSKRSLDDLLHSLCLPGHSVSSKSEPRREPLGVDLERDLLIEELAEKVYSTLRIDWNLQLTIALLEELITFERYRHTIPSRQAVSSHVS